MTKQTTRKKKVVRWKSLENDLSKGLNLAIAMIPKSTWGQNLHHRLPSSEWARIKERTLGDSAYKCSICDSPNKLHCDELWEYDNRRKIQKLVGLRTLCSMCHFVKHIGHAGILAEKGKLDFSQIVQHFLSINGCDLLFFDEHLARAEKLWKERSRHKWTVDFGGYA